MRGGVLSGFGRKGLRPVFSDGDPEAKSIQQVTDGECRSRHASPKAASTSSQGNSEVDAVDTVQGVSFTLRQGVTLRRRSARENRGLQAVADMRAGCHQATL